MAGWIGKFLTVLSGAPQSAGDEASEPQKPYAGITDPVDLAFVRRFTQSSGLFLYCGLAADAMATTCHAAVAQTGGIMITDAQTQGLKFAQLPAIHLVVARVSQVVNSLSDGMSAINKYHREQRPLSIITLKGKRDEAVLQAKVDPNKGRELYFFLVEDHLFTDL